MKITIEKLGVTITIEGEQEEVEAAASNILSMSHAPSLPIGDPIAPTYYPPYTVPYYPDYPDLAPSPQRPYPWEYPTGPFWWGNGSGGM